MDFNTFCFALTAVLTTLTYLVGFIFAARHRRRSTRASNYVLFALTLLLVSYLGRGIGMMLVTSRLPATGVAQFSVSIAVFQAIMFAGAVGLFIAAAFVDRGTTAGNRPHEYLPGDDQRASPSSNPYHHESR